jgi:lysozyme
MNLIDMIKLNEGMVMENGRHIPYEDSVGKMTIGFGRNLTDMGISEGEAQTLLWNDVENVIKELDQNLPFFNDLSENRRYALIDMCFNLGLTRFMGFKKMLTALERKEYDIAADEALDSKWAKQVGSRAKRDAQMIGEG